MKKGGFTLVELIAVVIILGILAAVGIPQYRKTMERARGAEAFAGLSNIRAGEKIYYAQNQAYYDGADTELTAADQTALDVSLPQSGWTFGITGVTATDFVVTATRRLGQGPCATTTIVVNAAGPVTDAWTLCVNAL